MNAMNRLLLCTDLDRTLLPNGEPPESPGVREIFAHLVSHPEVRTVFVTGRDPGRVDTAREEWGLPLPDLLIADVGTTIASPAGDRWARWEQWDEAIAADWAGRTGGDLAKLLAGIPGLVAQDASRQAAFKLSFFTGTGEEGTITAGAVRERLAAEGVRANVILSVDDNTQEGLLDVLPASATKRLAIEYIMGIWGFAPDEVLFAGDSGNDLDVLVSPIPAVLVANADPGLRRQARESAVEAGFGSRLHLAEGGVLGLNGNYAAGILEGLLHFHPAWAGYLQERT